MKIRTLSLFRVSTFALCVFSPYAMAHDMTSVFAGILLVLAIPSPALIVLTGWKKTLLYLIPIWAVAIMLLDSGYDGLMYIVLLSPYAIWLGRWVLNRKKVNNHEA